LLELHERFLPPVDAACGPLAAAIFSIRFNAILAYMCPLGWTGSLAHPALMVCTFFSMLQFSPQTSWIPSRTVAGARLFLSSNFCLFRSLNRSGKKSGS
jgi:hypothetical protein